MTTKNLAEIIKANPGAVALVDNDSWRLYKTSPYSNPHDTDENFDGEAAEAWDRDNTLACDSDKFEPPLSARQCLEGRGLLEALASLAGITVQGV